MTQQQTYLSPPSQPAIKEDLKPSKTPKQNTVLIVMRGDAKIDAYLLKVAGLIAHNETKVLASYIATVSMDSSLDELPESTKRKISEAQSLSASCAKKYNYAIDFEAYVVRDPGDGILKAIEDSHCTLVVMGVPFKEQNELCYNDPVSKYVMQHTDRRVWLIRAGKDI